MSERYYYLAINLLSIIVPLVASFHPRVRFYKDWGRLFLSILIVGLLFVVWDAVFTSWGIWAFNDRYLCGIYFVGLPMEELLFFICIPYCCVFSYRCFQLFWPKFQLSSLQTNIVGVLLAVLAVLIVVTHPNQLYSLVTFALSGIFLTVFLIRRSAYKWMGRFMASYGVMLLPMLVVNGALTGAYTPEPVVIYNEHEIIGWRINCMPIEDFMYGFLLLALITNLYERLGKLQK